MTSNLVKSMNDIFKGFRNLPITALVRATYFRLASLFATKGERCSAVLKLGQLFSESCIKLENIKVGTHTVTIFDIKTFNV